MGSDITMDNDIRRLLHDVRNPLNTISMSAELGKLTLERTGDIDKAAEIFASILRECRSCSDMLTHLKTSILAECQGSDDG